MGSRRARPRAGAEALNFCANNYLGLADHPRVVAAAADALDAVGLRDGQRPVHLRHPDPAHGAGGGALGVPRHRGHDPVLLLLRRQRRRLRDPLRRAGRDHLRRAQPRLDHRRDPPLQGGPLPLPERRHGRPRGAAGRGGRGPHPGDRHRRRLLDGRLPRPAGPDLRPRRAVRRAGPRRRLPRGRVRRARRPRDPRALRGHGPRRHPHRHARQGARRRVRRLRRRRARRSSTCCASGPGPYLFSNAVAPTVAAGSPGRPRDRGRRPTRPARRCAATPRCSAR